MNNMDIPTKVMVDNDLVGLLGIYAMRDTERYI